MKNIVFIDLQTNPFYTTNMDNILFGKSVAKKHEYLLKRLLRDNKINVCNVVTKYGTTLCPEFRGPFNLWPKIYTKLTWLENLYVMKYNNLSKQVKRIRISDIYDDDIIIAYPHTNTKSLHLFENVDAKKIISFIHFYGDKAIEEEVRKYNPLQIICEARLNKYSKAFKKNYSWYNKDIFLLPYTYQKRFIKKKDLSSRKKKAVAMGTVTYYESNDFIDTYHTTCYQPLRQQILDNADHLEDIIDNYISSYREGKINIGNKDSIFKVIYKKVKNLYTVGTQKKYFSFDMVEKYNEYQIAICPEDIQGAPGIGFVEAMACGCAYIGLKYGGYEDYGMIEGKHYIGYDGTLEDLRKKIEYYLQDEHQDELALIANEGMNFVRENFSQEKVANKFMDFLEKLEENNN